MVEKRGAANFTFRKDKKISNKEEIKEIYNTGIKWDCKSYRIIYRVNSSIKNRFAVLVSKKIGNAVYRNKVKRIFREIFRQYNAQSPPFLDILIQTKPGIKINDINGNCFIQWQKNIK